MQSVLVSQQVSVSRQFFRKFGENAQYWKTDFHKYSENQFITSNHQNRHRQALLMHAPSSRKQSEGLWCSYLRLRLTELEKGLSWLYFYFMNKKYKRKFKRLRSSKKKKIFEWKKYTLYFLLSLEAPPFHDMI